MNELMIVLQDSTAVSSGELYFKTEQINVDRALTEFCETCDNNGINIEHLQFKRAELRDRKGNPLGEVEFK